MQHILLFKYNLLLALAKHSVQSMDNKQRQKQQRQRCIRGLWALIKNIKNKTKTNSKNKLGSVCRKAACGSLFFFLFTMHFILHHIHHCVKSIFNTQKKGTVTHNSTH